MPARRITMIPIVCGLIFAFTGAACRLGPAPIADPDRSRRLTSYSFIEEGKLVVFVVDIEAARFRLADSYVPLYVGVANRTVSAPLQITRESFYLVDEDGVRTPLASVAEVMRGYRFHNLDRRLLADRGAFATKFDFYTRFVTRFFPNPSGMGVVQDRIELPRGTYLEDLLYFPMPDGGIAGRRFDLFLDCKPLEDPVFVTFEIPAAKGGGD